MASPLSRTAPRRPRQPGWYIPWIIAAPFLVVFAVNGTLVHFALSSFSGLTSEHASDEGAHYNLALAAAKLGCERIIAVDYNYLAARTARQNVALNPLDDRILVVNGRAEEHTAIATDLLVANIHFDVMKDLVRTEGFLRQKWFILSGLLGSEAEKILEFLATQPVLILKRWNQDDIWHTILGITRS